MSSLELLTNTVVLFGAALVVAWALRAIGGPAIIGFLFTGMLIGPSGIGLIAREAVFIFTDLGLIMLLFTIGLELSPEPLIRSGRRLVFATILQLLGTAGVGVLVLSLASTVTVATALIIAIAVTNSSTAIVLKVLSDRGETDSTAGTITTGMVLLQDISLIVVMLLLPMFAPTGPETWAASIGRSAITLIGLAVLTVLARRALPFVLDQIISRGGGELTTLFSVFMACVGAWLAGQAGWSMALGACIAGLLLSGADVRHQLLAEILPFRDVFNALFFISIGMLVNFEIVAAHPLLLLSAVVATIVIKTLLTAGPVVAVGWPIRTALHVGLGLCTVSEFAYILISESAKLQIVTSEALDAMIVFAVGTMLLGAVLVPLAGPLAGRVSALIEHQSVTHPAQTDTLSQHVIIVGYGLNGRNLSRVLRATKIPHCVVEINRGLAHQAKETGVPVIIGDATRRSILTNAGLAAARALVVGINDTAATRRIVAQARNAHANLYILARTRYVSELEPLYRLGAQRVIPEEFETSIEIFAHVLKEFAVPDNVVETQIAMVRAGGYEMLRGRPGGERRQTDLLALLEATATQTFLVERHSPAFGRSLREIDLRAATGVTVIAVVRRGSPTTNPPADLRLESGDVLVMVGTHKQLIQARSLLAPPAGEPSVP
jgi:CPA2 family monovalent cation:H+ antiporter-2